MTDLEELPKVCDAHCFHLDNARMYTSYPAQYDEVCCFCGFRQLHRPVPPPPPPGHGPHYPHQYRYQGTVTWSTGGASCRCQHGGVCNCVVPQMTHWRW